MIRSGTTVAGLLLAVAGCASMAPPAMLDPAMAERELPGTPAQVTQAAVSVFAENGIPVAAVSPETGLVQGQQMVVRRTWGGAAVNDRFDCGRSLSGVPRAAFESVAVSLAVLAQQQGAGTRVRITASATTQPEPGSGVGGTAGTPYSCQLREGFTSMLLDQMAARLAGVQRTTP